MKLLTTNWQPRFARAALSKTGALCLAALALLALGSPKAWAQNCPPGAVFTSTSGCDVINANIYDSKDDVYLNGGPDSADRLDGYYYVRVLSPEGTPLGHSTITVHFDGTTSCPQLSAMVVKESDGTQGYDDTDNGGGAYKVEVSCDSSFPGSETKSDIFKGASRNP